MPHENGRIYGSFKKICIPEPELKLEAKSILPNLISLKSDWETAQISDSQLTFQLVLLYLERRVKKHPFLRMGKPLPSRNQSKDFLEVVRFYGMPDTVRFALWKWHIGEWDIRLIDYNPSSLEMLESQSRGYRYSTISWEHAMEGSLVEDKRDAFEHLLHDLAHAYMFFREDYDYEGQKQFFKEMMMDYPKYESVLNTNSIFREKFDYCISDMNSHPAHLSSYWNAIRREAGIPVDQTLRV
ncbi:hypothetical protein [Leptospira kanakyensis]|uniref:Uncharacterized protein n=1 Tax=Leptospira kanakyensis TaxID=2484968 RepID=A0A6N4Q6L3_9LEPT|nr:hypothetical protein [Leptospira kanakyensis]MCW7470934.1 hypothetical protein [Leptospira kanakyensis]MCW7483150.1 hypothetical protein [Leptospira kanakyensis]TGK54386.1 hypothetical protein EHQ11_02190 [Leptospira kanakyensis]TGK59146.1 hypothetical protein EHQ16_12425 [Leptospira kanakyensis]TGK75296.1 hypothetical protein EHQ18_03100 [Leptospira kanakyensis]